MIVLDTNVLSEPFKPNPSPRLLEWLDNQSADTLFISVITRAELRFGVARLPDGKRKAALAAQVEEAINLFAKRTIVFDEAAADELAAIAAHCERIGRPIVAPDLYVAACAAARGFAVATRNVSHFEHTGVRVINPWE